MPKKTMEDYEFSLNFRSKGDLLDRILYMRNVLAKCTEKVSSIYTSISSKEYYTRKFKKVHHRCQLAGKVLIEKIGENVKARILIYIFARHPEVFIDFIKEFYYYPAWETSLRGMIEKDYLSEEDVYIMNALEMHKRYVGYLSFLDVKNDT